MSKPDILIMFPLRDHAMAQLEAAFTLHRLDQAEDKQAFLAQLGPKCVGVATHGHRAKLTRAHLEHLPNLKIVASSSAGVEDIDVEALKERGIHLTNSSPALRDDVADLALLLTLAARRQLVAADAYVRSGEWGRSGMYPLLSSITGKHAGIVGLGRIGLAIAKRFEPLGLHIGYTSRSRKQVPYRFDADVRALAAWSDILVVAVPGGQATEGLIDREVLEALGPQGTLINIARGQVVDEPALVAALGSGALGSAGLDVYWHEPNPDPALTSLPNVTLYPHHASGTEETRDAMAQLVVDNLTAYFAGKPLFSPV